MARGILAVYKLHYENPWEQMVARLDRQEITEHSGIEQFFEWMYSNNDALIKVTTGMQKGYLQ